MDQMNEISPVKIIPELPGRWVWQDNKTIVFEPDEKRFPMGSHFEYKIDKKSCQSLNGRTLKKDFKFSFSTPSPSVYKIYPVPLTTRKKSSGTSRTPFIGLMFNQEVDEDRFLKSLIVGYKKSGRIDRINDISIVTASQVFTEDESQVNKDYLKFYDYVDNRSKTLKETDISNHVIFFKIDSPIPENTEFSVTIPQYSVIGKEGPNPTDRAQEFQFNTYGPLQLLIQSKTEIFDIQIPCSLTFSNPIKNFHPSQITF